MANDEYEAITLAREIMAHLNYHKKSLLPRSHVLGSYDPPLYSSEEILGIVSPDLRIPYDSREIIARIVDGSRFSEFKPLYGDTIINCYATIHGFPVGIISNNGVIFSESSNKAAQFIQLCNQISIPIIFLHNITGFIVGKKYEHEGIIKHGSKMINAVTNSEVPHLTIIMGASYGAGNYAMCGRSYNPRFLFTWPNSKVAVMGPDQLAGVMDIIQRQAAVKVGKPIDEEKFKERTQFMKEKVESECDAYFCTSRLYDDGIIDPRDTRNVLGLCLSLVYSGEVKSNMKYGVSRM